MAAPILEIRNLKKYYTGRSRTEGGEVKAVDGVSFAIRDGSCFGLLGPNGAGKTTTLEVIEGISRPTSGEILFQGQPAGADFRQKTGIQFQATALPDYLTVSDVLRLFGSFYKHTAPIAELRKLCSLDEFWDRDTDRLSGGQRQRVLLAIALINDPDLIFLDKPTTGLDPQARRNFWELIRTIKARGKTVVLTTHYMEEAYELCDEIAIMDHGHILTQGSPDGLLRKHFDRTVIELPADDVKVPIASLADAHVSEDGRVEIQARDVNETLRALMGQGISLTRMRLRPPTLEDLFIELTGKNLRA